MILGLLIFSLLGFFLHKNDTNLLRSEKFFILSFLLYFLITTLGIVLLDGEFRDLDVPSRLAIMIPIYFLLRRYRIDLSWLIWGFVIAGIIFGLNITLNLFSLSLFEFTKNIGIVAFYCSISGLISLFLISKSNTYFINFVLLTGFVFGMLGMIYMGGRGVWISNVIIVFLILILNLKKYSVKHKISILFIVLSAFIFGIYSAPKDVHDRIAEVENVKIWIFDKNNNEVSEKNNLSRRSGSNKFYLEESSSQRLEMWKAALMIIKDNFIFGIGEDNYKLKKNQLIEQGVISKYVAKFSHPHNEYLSAFVEQGVFGFLSLIGVFLVPLWIIWMEQKSESKLSLKKEFLLGYIVILHYVFYSFTSGVFDHQNTTIFYSFIVIALISSIHKAKRI